MTRKLFQSDPYRKSADATVAARTNAGGIVLDQTIFYPAGGGQPGDTGRLHWQSGSAAVLDTRKFGLDDIELIVDDGDGLLPVGAGLQQELDWVRRYRHMRIHTALHLLSVVIPLPVTSGAIKAEKGRLDFDMPEAIADKGALERQLNEIAGRDLPVAELWISDAELAANPGLVKTMSAKPPVGSGQVRLVRIGEGAGQVDLQPCGGTHVARTGEIGTITVGKIEKKGRLNRRINITVD